MRVRLKGINSKRKRLADGSYKTYWYAWKGGPALRGEPGSPEFHASYNEAVAQKIKPPTGILFGLLRQYQDSEDFRKLAASTRRSYVQLLTRIERDLGDFPLSALSDRRTRGVFMAWRDKTAVASGRRQADYAWTVLARVLSWSCKPRPDQHQSVRARRPPLSQRPERQVFGPRKMKRPSCDRVRRICTYRCCWRYGPASDKAIYCDFRGRPMTASIFACGKARAGRASPIPVGAPLKAALDATPKRSTIILTNSDGNVDVRRLPRVVGQGVQACRRRRPDVPRSARHCRNSAGDRRLHRGRDRDHHRALTARCPIDPRCTLSASRSGAGRERDAEAGRAERRTKSPD